MITQSQILKKALAPWNSGAFLKSCVHNTPLFPMEIPFRTPTGKELLQKYDDVRAWIHALQRGGKEAKKAGYDIVWRTIDHRSLGNQQLPRRIIFSTPGDWLAYIKKQTEYQTFMDMIAQTRSVLPELIPYLGSHPLKALGYAVHWSHILKVCEWFKKHPRPRQYIRQLDIAGVDTKFIESHKGLLMDLLPRVLEEGDCVSTITGLAKHGFERKFGLLYDPPLVRLRLLDPDLMKWEGSDITLPLRDLAHMDMGADMVFVTENKINGLAFPRFPKGMVIFGLGYGVEMLPHIEWLERKNIVYWGDVDTHGFSILSQVRGVFPHTRAMLMDRETLLAHKALWGAEPSDKRYTGILPHLTAEERELFMDLAQNKLGPHVRLEQERIRFSAVRRALGWLMG